MQQSSKLSDLLSRMDRIKSAADAYNSEMPDDPTGDGTQDLQTGSAFSEYNKEFKKIKSPGTLAANEDAPSFDADNQTDHSLSDFTLSTAGSEEQSSKGELEAYAPDPGTSMPAEAGQEKYSSAHRCTLEENIAYFEKFAGAYLQTANVVKAAVAQEVNDAVIAVNAVNQLNPGDFTKFAAESGASPDEQAEVAALEALVEEHPEIIEEILAASPEEQADAAVAAEDAISGAPESDSIPEELLPSEEELATAEMEKQCFYASSPSDQAMMARASIQELDAMTKVASAYNFKAAEGDLSAEEAAAILSEIEDDSDDSKEDDEDKEAGCCKKKAANMSSAELFKEASFKRQLEEEQAAFLSLHPSDQIKIAEADPAEIAEAINALESESAGGNAESDDIANANILEEMSGDSEGDNAIPEEAVAVDELSSALADAGVTPEMLAAIAQEKQGSYNREEREDAVFLYDNAVKVADWRNSGNWRYGAPTTQKRAELRRGFARYLQEVCSR